MNINGRSQLSIEEIKSYSSVDVMEMTKQKMITNISNELMKKADDIITINDDKLRGIMTFDLSIYVETEKEREQKHELLYETLSHYDIPKPILRYIFREIL